MSSRFGLLALMLALGVQPASAEEPDQKSQFFAALYVQTCMKHFGDPAGLRSEFERQQVPQLPPEKAQYFLAGGQGSAWVIPNPFGDFVVSLRDEVVCAVHARRVNAEEVERRFAEIVSVSPPPLVLQKLGDEQAISPNGPTRTVSYAWLKPQENRKLLFTLTTAASPEAQIQAMASLVLVRD